MLVLRPRERGRKPRDELVIKVDGGQMTTLGGNEDDRIQINTQGIEAGENGLARFGILDKG